ncbi:hypothetical protein [Lysobacter humi (ex Lee et al. 2017)]
MKHAIFAVALAALGMAGFAMAGTKAPERQVAQSSTACAECYNKWMQCGGGSDDYCTMRYEICMRQNRCGTDDSTASAFAPQKQKRVQSPVVN